MDYRIHGILQARIPEWVAFPFSRGSSQPRDRTHVSHIAGTINSKAIVMFDIYSKMCLERVKKYLFQIFEPPSIRVCILSCIQLFATPWPGFSVHGIFQASILEMGCQFLFDYYYEKRIVRGWNFSPPPHPRVSFR